MDRPLSKAERDGLQTVEWAMKYFDAAHTGRNFRRSTALKLEARGLIRSIGLCQPCDGDGFIIATRQEREGWVLTEKGRLACLETTGIENGDVA